MSSEIFLDNHTFNYPENLFTNFSERKDIDFCCGQINGDISKHPLTLNEPLQYTKRLVNITAR